MKIWTHNGRADADSVLTSAVLIALGARHFDVPARSLPLEVIRVGSIDDLPEALGADEYVVGIGGVYHPEGHRFDNVPNDDNASMTARVVDAFLKDIVRDPEWNKVFSPDNPTFLEEGLLSLFETIPVSIARVVAGIIEIRWKDLLDRENAEKWLLENYEIGMTKGVIVLQLTADPRDAGVDASWVKAAQGALIRNHQVHLVYGWSVKQKGVRALYRTALGESLMDLSKVNPDDKVFTGPSLALFRPCNELEWRNLLGQALN